MTSEAIKKSDSWMMFNKISKRYDTLNRVLSFGLDIKWRKDLVKFLPGRKELKSLDLATGTADVPLFLLEKSAQSPQGPQFSHITGLDMAEGMLEVGRQKISKLNLGDKITLIAGDANKIPFNENEFDTTTMSFGIRNVEDPRVVLKEMFRVLKPGGRTLILEFSMPQNPFIRFFHLAHLRVVVPSLGSLISGNYSAYKYLNQTIENFAYGDAFLKMMTDVGFKNVKANPLLFGTASIYQGDKLS